MKQKKVLIFCIGKEPLAGLVLGRDAGFMAGQVETLGCRVASSIQALDDIREEMARSFRPAITQRPDYGLATDGMGPVHTGLTRASVATA